MIDKRTDGGEIKGPFGSHPAPKIATGRKQDFLSIFFPVTSNYINAQLIVITLFHICYGSKYYSATAPRTLGHSNIVDR